jgi:hypothetical protein
MRPAHQQKIADLFLPSGSFIDRLALIGLEQPL